MRTPVIGVMGGSKATPTVTEMAHELGTLIAQHGWILLNGGRNSGVMAASAAGAKSAGGIVIGILPDTTRAKASPDLDVAILTGTGDGRNLFNVLSSDIVVACPGALGTLAEVVLALKHNKHVVLLGFDLGSDFDKFRNKRQLTHADTPGQAVDLIAAALNTAGA